MNFSLKPNTIISHFLPGAFFLLAIAATLALHFGPRICDVDKLSGPIVALLGGAGFPLALIIGLVFDAFRNLIWERCCGPIDWDIFAQGETQFLTNLMDSYYGFYVFDVNLIISIVCTAIAALVLNIEFGLSFKMSICILFVIVAVLVIILLFFDAKDLRKEIKELIEKERTKAELNNAESATT